MAVRVVKGRAFEAFADGHDRATQLALAELGELARTDIVEAMAERVDTGNTRQATRSRPVERTPNGYRSVVDTQPPQDVVAIVMEEGRRPGKRWPPEAPIRRWVGRKLRDKILSRLTGARVTAANRRTGKVTGVARDDAEEALDEVTFLVRRKIGRVGLPALRFFGKVADKLRAGLFRRRLEQARARYRGAR